MTLMKKFLFLLTLLAPLAAAAAGNTNSYAINVGQFDRLSVQGDIPVIYRCDPDSTGYVTFEATPDMADAFSFTITKGKLKIQVDSPLPDPDEVPVIRVYSDFLTEVDNASARELSIYDPAPVPSFQATQIGNGSILVDGLSVTRAGAIIATGNGSVTLSGSCTDADFKMVGAGLIQADLLRADKVDCKILGSGSIGCWATENLNVKGIGSTKIYYKGTPEIKKTGGGKLFPIED